MEIDKLINIKTFLDNYELFFETERHKISWVKRNLKLKTLIRVRLNYIGQKNEIEKNFQKYLNQQKALYEKNLERLKQMRKNKLVKEKKTIEVRLDYATKTFKKLEK